MPGLSVQSKQVQKKLDPNTGSLNLDVHCPGKLKDFRIKLY